MQNSKNLIIAALVALVLIAAIWGQNEAGKRKQLLRDKEALQTQIKANDHAVTVSAELRAELERQKDALKQAQNRLSNAQNKIDELEAEKKTFAEKITAQGEAVQAAEELKQSSTAEATQKLQDMQAQLESLQSQCSEEKAGLEQQLAQQQTALEEQEQKLTAAAQIIENEQKQLKGCKEEIADSQQTQAALRDAEAANQQLEEERDKVLADTETLRAQVIGLEKMVEERNADLKQTRNELDNCKINNDVLIAQISQKGCREKSKMKQEMLMPEQKETQEPVQKQ